MDVIDTAAVAAAAAHCFKLLLATPLCHHHACAVALVGRGQGIGAVGGLKAFTKVGGRV